MSTEPIYPAPPWTMHGEAYFAPYLVKTGALELPEGLEVIHGGPYTVGMLGYVRYVSPSPILYDELIWMPCFVRAPAFGPRASGWFVSIMYVDEPRTLAGGREIWKIPKTMARFTRGDGTLDVQAEDGTAMSLRFGTLGPRVRATGRIATLQWNDGRSMCRFGATSTADVGMARLSVEHFASSYSGWMGFDPSARMPAPGLTQQGFVSRMQVPTFVTRTPHG